VKSAELSESLGRYFIVAHGKAEKKKEKKKLQVEKEGKNISLAMISSNRRTEIGNQVRGRRVEGGGRRTGVGGRGHRTEGGGWQRT
jgi:hypothetical protein